MSCFAGLAIGLANTAVCLMDQEGEIQHEAMVPTDPGSLAQYLGESGLSFKRIGMEACPLSQWLFDGLVNEGFPAICVEIRHLQAAMSAMTHKSDRNEARGIAQVMRTAGFDLCTSSHGRAMNYGCYSPAAECLSAIAELCRVNFEVACRSSASKLARCHNEILLPELSNWLRISQPCWPLSSLCSNSVLGHQAAGCPAS